MTSLVALENDETENSVANGAPSDEVKNAVVSAEPSDGKENAVVTAEGVELQGAVNDELVVVTPVGALEDSAQPQ